jgi:hypothetical protein
VRWPTACEDVTPGADKHPLLEDVTIQSNEDYDISTSWNLFRSNSTKFSLMVGDIAGEVLDPQRVPQKCFKTREIRLLLNARELLFIAFRFFCAEKTRKRVYLLWFFIIQFSFFEK